MPIANCIVNKKVLSPELEGIIEKLSRELHVENTDITINFIQSEAQLGKKYALMIYLYIPSLWSRESMEKMELSFIEILSKALGIPYSEVFLITTVVPSGQVATESRVEHW